MAGKGGARSVSGPPPDQNALRRDRDKTEWATLPGKREGDPPAWPLTQASQRELDIWTEEWVRPQAVMWEANGQEREVALYVRAFAAAEKPKAVVATRTLVRQLMDDLGISLVGLRRHRWLIAGPIEQPVVRTDDPKRNSAKTRLRSIPGGVA